MIQLTLMNCGFDVQDFQMPTDDPQNPLVRGKMLMLSDPASEIAVHVPLTEAAAEEISRQLKNGPRVEVARAMPGGLPDLGSRR